MVAYKFTIAFNFSILLGLDNIVLNGVIGKYLTFEFNWKLNYEITVTKITTYSIGC